VRVRRGKGGKSRVVPLGEEACAWLEEYLRRGRPRLLRGSSPWLFLTRKGRPVNRAHLAWIVRQAAARAGLGKHVTPHVLRHCCATHMLRRGAGLRHLQELLGHSLASSTQRYTRIEVSDLRKVLARCHPRERRR
jgi:integrase/recombinase XerD